jgi:hypothetical protein
MRSPSHPERAPQDESLKGNAAESAIRFDACVRRRAGVLRRQCGPVLVLLALFGCGATPSRPAFEGRQTDSWIAFDEDVPDRDPRELLMSFEASARAFGCRTDRIGGRSVDFAGGGRAKISAGVAAYCDEGSLALMWVAEARVRIGCERPTTRERCEALLRRIGEAR